MMVSFCSLMVNFCDSKSEIQYLGESSIGIVIAGNIYLRVMWD